MGRLVCAHGVSVRRIFRARPCIVRSRPHTCTVTTLPNSRVLCSGTATGLRMHGSNRDHAVVVLCNVVHEHGCECGGLITQDGTPFNLSTFLLQDRCSTACFVKKENTQWKVELAQLNDAIRASVSEEDWEDIEELNIDQSSPKITDQERVYLVGVRVKSRKPDADSFTGAPRPSRAHADTGS